MTITITIIGAGISGLSSAVALQEVGFHVTIVAAEEPEKTTSAAAAGIWMPFHAGNHPRTGAWLQTTYEYCRQAQNDPATGVFFIEHNSYFLSQDLDVADEFRTVEGFRILAASELKYGAQAGFSLHLPVMPSHTLLPFLIEKFKKSGGIFSWRKITNLADEAKNADLVVNCTGYGAQDLCGDETVEAAKGHVVVVANPGLHKNIVVSSSDGFTHIFPCGDSCILGGIYQVGNLDPEPDPLVTRDILIRARALEPLLENVPVLAVRTGLRPIRPAVRLEIEILPGGGKVIHNYGHGGAGYTMSRGCAEDVVALASELLMNM